MSATDPVTTADLAIATEHSEEPPPSRPATALMALGWVVIAIGVWGALGHINHFAGTIPWFQLAKWTVGLALLNDLVVAPLICLVALFIAKVVPARLRPVLASAAIITGPVTLMAIPAVRRYGAIPGSDSILPGEYGKGLIITLAVIWGVALIAAVVVWLRKPQPSAAV